jgi:hypothetical protein
MMPTSRAGLALLALGVVAAVALGVHYSGLWQIP